MARVGTAGADAGTGTARNASPFVTPHTVRKLPYSVPRFWFWTPSIAWREG
jgi:hypothetical protein